MQVVGNFHNSRGSAFQLARQLNGGVLRADALKKRRVRFEGQASALAQVDCERLAKLWWCVAAGAHRRAALR